MNRTSSTVLMCVYWEFHKEKSEKGAGNVFEEIMVRNIPKLMKNMNLQIQESPQISIGQTQRDPHLDTT